MVRVKKSIEFIVVAFICIACFVLFQGQFARTYMDAFATSNYSSATGDTITGNEYDLGVLTNQMSRQSTYRNIGYNSATGKMYLYVPGVYSLRWTAWIKSLTVDTLEPIIRIAGNASTYFGHKMPIDSGYHRIVLDHVYNFSSSSVSSVDSIHIALKDNGTDADTVVIHGSEFTIIKHRNAI